MNYAGANVISNFGLSFKMMKRIYLSIFFAFLLCPSIYGQVAEYFFCIESEEYESFKAHVVFNGLDFGEASAKQMARNDLEKLLGEDMKITSFSEQDCPCKSECQQVEVKAKDWDGNLEDRGLSLESLWGSTVEIGDAIISEGNALWNNPGEFLMSRVLGRKE